MTWGQFYMNNSRISAWSRKGHLFAGAGIAALMLVSSPAVAQDASDDTTVEADSTDQASEAIIVTGSRIRSPQITSTVPVTTFGGDTIYKQGEHNLGEALNELPALRSTYAQSNPGLGIGVAGLNLLDLRGLGIQRTLVLVDGRRHVPSDLQVTASAVDINTIPTDLVERVDIVTGGNSAVYGSDAIAGVVNFIMKKDFDGLIVRGGAGTPEYGAGANYFASATGGKNFGDGRGNISASIEYTRQKRLFASQVPWRRNQVGFVTTQVDPTGERFDGTPDRTFFDDIRSATISRTGLVSFPQNVGNAACGGLTLGGTPFNCDYIFTPSGELVPVTFDERIGTSPYSSYIGGNAETGNEGEQTSVYPSSERYVGSIMGHYTFSDAFELFASAKWAHIRSTGSNSGPAFNQGQYITFNDERAQYRLDNPFLSQQARTTITNALLASGNNNGIVNVFGPLSAADRTAIANGTYRFESARAFTDLGIRDEDATRDTYRIVVGARGQISKNWSYEVSANYGETKEDIKVLGNVNVQRLMLAMDAGINPATGKIECRSQFDPNAAYASPDVSAEGGAATLANDIAQCVAYNPFGLGDNSRAKDYIVSNAGSQGHLRQFDAMAFVSGDTSGFFELPGGPVSLVVGGEYRRENAYFKADDVINQGLTFLNSLATFDPNPVEVKEAFGEIEIPVFANQPFFEELSFSGAARVSDYNNSAGTVWAYNFGGRWSPVRDITFRANFGHAIRAPNYTETDSPLSQNFASFQDPCATVRLTQGTDNRQAACQAALGANLTNTSFQTKVSGTYSLEIMSGGNPNLTAETSDSLTIGAVFQPRWVPGLAITVDYYDIKVNNVISSVGAQAIVNNCYDLPAGNPFCDQFQRYTGTGTGPNGEVPGEILVGSLIEGPVNFAKRVRRGIDVDVNYRTELAPSTFLAARAYYTHGLKSSNYEDSTNPDFENRVLSELGNPKDEFVLYADLTVDDFTFGYKAHFIGPMYIGSYEDYFPMNGDPALNPDGYPVSKFPSVLYHGIRAAWQVGGSEGDRPFEFYVGVDNLFDKHPPLSASGLTSGSAIYDVFGRRFYTGFRAKF
ncbi:TonB-dependent receptor [Tsuneonella suprasediminis]|uniref:TonB-dependent receptor n=2 Tax=Tsuneonella suprasediminis TaxID=2306996 RepID=A0A419R2T2_9SPHN|nr:TonB-dependent receptor [Tsuneonella suprasediminis]